MAEKESIPRTSKLADQTFASTQIRDDATACDTLENVFAVPCDKMAIVNDVLFTFMEL